MEPIGAVAVGNARRPPDLPAREIRFRNVTFAYPGGAPVLEGFDLTIPAGSSLAIVGQNGAGKTTLAKLLCRLYDPQVGAIEVDGIDVRDFDLGVVAIATDGRVSGFHAVRVAAARQRGSRGRAAMPPLKSALESGRRGEPRQARHDPGPRLRRRHRAFGRAVAADRAGSGPVCDRRRGGRRAAR